MAEQYVLIGRHLVGIEARHQAGGGLAMVTEDMWVAGIFHDRMEPEALLADLHPLIADMTRTAVWVMREYLMLSAEVLPVSVGPLQAQVEGQLEPFLIAKRKLMALDTSFRTDVFVPVEATMRALLAAQGDFEVNDDFLDYANSWDEIDSHQIIYDICEGTYRGWPGQ